ncbi:Hsp33 family molecular chaperone HslO [Luteimonas sp. SJ-92]|uniref:Hsp33 family molecular chaperone HslO n=1 Tax=Luteimonas salinisoli TaxID=2752307 RepID=A0A853JIR9_9GAMM|nr:Hsp33 family molecular chaperone HslO [Luteimonas salinisoli]NZA28290.1 Hsp33 family molecular chaperone HslO [Luteimonas salinisoli]
MTDRPADTDRLDRFLLPRAGVRGVRVHLGQTWKAIRGRDSHPPATAALLGEASAAAALFTGHAKVDGRLSVHLRGQGALRALFSECTAAGTLRGILRLAEDAATAPRGLRDAGDGATLAVTIENPGAGSREPQRYQGLVELTADSLSEAFEDYFRQSEQLPTRLLLAAGDSAAAGLMLQKLPGDTGDVDGWNRASALFDTLSAAELLAWPAATLLHRLFHEEAPQALGGRPLRFGCSCSGERVAAVLQSLGPDEARAAVIDGLARVHCEFCGQAYHFDRSAIDALFTGRGAPMDAPTRLQ